MTTAQEQTFWIANTDTQATNWQPISLQLDETSGSAGGSGQFTPFDEHTGAKIFFEDKRFPETKAKVRAMIAHRAQLIRDLSFVTWPIHHIYTQKNKSDANWAGYTLPIVNARVSLNAFATVDVKKRERQARNLAGNIITPDNINKFVAYICLGLATHLHRFHTTNPKLNLVFGDFNAGNVIFNPGESTSQNAARDVKINFIDPDGYGITLGGKRYPPQGTKVHERSIGLVRAIGTTGTTANYDWSQADDNYTLALHLYRIFANEHPFTIFAKIPETHRLKKGDIQPEEQAMHVGACALTRPETRPEGNQRTQQFTENHPYLVEPFAQIFERPNNPVILTAAEWLPYLRKYRDAAPGQNPFNQIKKSQPPTQPSQPPTRLAKPLTGVPQQANTINQPAQPTPPSATPPANTSQQPTWQAQRLAAINNQQPTSNPPTPQSPPTAPPATQSTTTPPQATTPPSYVVEEPPRPTLELWRISLIAVPILVLIIMTTAPFRGGPAAYFGNLLAYTALALGILAIYNYRTDYVINRRLHTLGALATLPIIHLLLIIGSLSGMLNAGFWFYASIILWPIIFRICADLFPNVHEIAPRTAPDFDTAVSDSDELATQWDEFKKDIQTAINITTEIIDHTVDNTADAMADTAGKVLRALRKARTYRYAYLRAMAWLRSPMRRTKAGAHATAKATYAAAATSAQATGTTARKLGIWARMLRRQSAKKPNQMRVRTHIRPDPVVDTLSFLANGCAVMLAAAVILTLHQPTILNVAKTTLGLIIPE